MQRAPILRFTGVRTPAPRWAFLTCPAVVCVHAVTGYAVTLKGVTRHVRWWMCSVMRHHEPRSPFALSDSMAVKTERTRLNEPAAPNGPYFLEDGCF